jgi:thioredoxin-related protein
MKIQTSLWLFFSLVLSVENSFGQGIEFFKGSWKDALSQAQRDKKLIFVDVFTDWCGPCKMLDKNVFPDPLVANKFNAQFVNFKLDAEAGEGIELAKKYKVQAYPNLLFVNGAGDLIYRVVGFRPVDELLQEADMALKQWAGQPLSWYEAQFEAQKHDSTYLLDYLDKLKTLEQPNTAVLSQYLALHTPEAQLSEPIVKRLAGYLNSLDGLPLELAIKAYRQVDKYSVQVQYTLAPSLFMLIQSEARKAAFAKDREHFNKAVAAIRGTGIPEAEETILGMEMDFAKQSGDFIAFDAFATQLATPAMARTDADIRKMSAKAYDSYLKNAVQLNQDTSSAELKNILAQMKNQGAFMTTFQLNQLAWAYVETMKDKKAWKKALKWSARSIQISPNDAASLDTYANLLYKLGKKKKAIEYQSRVVAINPDDPSAKETLEKIKNNTL